tara:strand:- start:84 stop:425 length:342 start_codon:yes stop_codon:yes gene_type:complete
MAIEIQNEIDIVIKQANLVRKYINQQMNYQQVAHEFMQLAEKSQLKQNFTHLAKWIESGYKKDPEQLHQEILDFDGLMKAIHEQAGDVDTLKYQQAQQYWNEAQNDLESTSYL